MLCACACACVFIQQFLLEWMGNVSIPVFEDAAPVTTMPASDVLYVFADNSNMHIGAQRGVVSTVPGREQTARVVFLHYANLVEKVLGTPPRFTARRYVAGVMPDVVAQMWREQEFVVRNGTTDDVHANIDEVLHAQILDTLMSQEPATLVLMTGDGNANGGRSSFPKCVAAALRLHWRVEVYCWRHSTSSFFMAAESLAKGRLVVHFLDKWREDVSFETDKLRTKQHAAKHAMLGHMLKTSGACVSYV